MTLPTCQASVHCSHQHRLKQSSLSINYLLCAGVFLALVFGAFLNGTSPSIADSHAGSGSRALATALSTSYNRWSLEALVLSEYKQWGQDKQTLIIATARHLGLCRLDILLPDDGDGVLSEREALAYLRMQEAWDDTFCDPARNWALGMLVVGGLVLRVGAFLVLMVTHKLSYWQSH